MKLGFHGATTMPADLQTDVAALAHAGFRTLELGIARVDRFLADHSLEDLKAGLAMMAPVPSNCSARSIGSGIPCNWRSRRGRQPSTSCPPTLQ